MKKYGFWLVLLVCLLWQSLTWAAPALPTEDLQHGVVRQAVDLQPTGENNKLVLKKGQMVQVEITTGPESGKTVEVYNAFSGQTQFDIPVHTGDKVLLSVEEFQGKRSYHISDYDRSLFQYVLLGLFVLSLVLLAGWVGVKSLGVIGITLYLLWAWLVPNLLLPGVNIYLLVIGFCIAAGAITLLFVSGWNLKSLAAFFGTLGGVLVAALLSWGAIDWLYLTGMETEEAVALKLHFAKQIDIHGILFAGMIIGALGAVIDVAVSVASAQWEMDKACPELSWQELFKSGMNVGKDIMGAMSNTLILAYLGTGLPLLLVVAAQPKLLVEKVINFNGVVTEFARAMTGSVGLIWAIPLTALASALLLRWRHRGD